MRLGCFYQILVSIYRKFGGKSGPCHDDLEETQSLVVSILAIKTRRLHQWTLTTSGNGRPVEHLSPRVEVFDVLILRKSIKLNQKIGEDVGSCASRSCRATRLMSRTNHQPILGHAIGSMGTNRCNPRSSLVITVSFNHKYI